MPPCRVVAGDFGHDVVRTERVSGVGMSESQVDLIGTQAPTHATRSDEAALSPGELMRHADEWMRQRNPAEAEPLYRTALERDPRQLKAYQQLALIAQRRGEPDVALDFLEQGLARRPGSAALLQAKARALRDLGRLEDAFAAILPLLEQDPPLEAAVIQAAELERLSGDLPAAQARLAALGPTVRGVTAELIRLARALRDAGRTEEALALLRATHAAIPHERGVLNLYADLVAAQGAAADPEEFERVLALRLEVEPGHVRSLITLAARRVEQGRREEADALLRQASLAHPADPNPYLRRAALAREADPTLALAILEEGLAQAPAVESLVRETARILSSLGREGEAEGMLRTLVPDVSGVGAASLLLRLDLAATVRRQGRLDEARELLGSAFTEQAEVREGLRLVSDLRITGRTSEALQVLQSILAVHPRDISALMTLCGVLQRKEAFDEARAVIEQVLKIDPTFGRAYAALADIQGRTQSAAAARATLELGFSLSAPVPELYATAATLLFGRGEDGDAWKRLKEGLEHFPTHRSLLRLAIDQSQAAGRFGDVGPWLDALPDTPEDRAARQIFLAKGALSRLQFEDATAALAEAEREDPDNHQVWIQGLLAAMPRLRIEEARRAQRQLRTLVRDGDPDLVHSAHRVLGFYSEVFNDLLTDPAAMVAGSDAVARNDLDRLRAVVRDFPDSTGIAVALVVALRRAGRLPGPRPGRAPTTSPIPRVLHQFWDTAETPEDLTPFIESWRALNPGWTCRLYDIAAAQEVLAQGMPGPVLQAFHAARHPAHKADIFRLAVLLREGGVYADVDDRCRGPLDRLCAGASLVLRHENLGSIGNNFMACRPGHPFIGKALLGAVKATLEGHSEAIWLSTGPGLVTRTFAQLYVTDDAMRAELEAQTRLLPDFVLRSFVACGLRAVYKSTQMHWVQQQFGSRPKAGGSSGPQSEESQDRGPEDTALAPQRADP